MIIGSTLQGYCDINELMHIQCQEHCLTQVNAQVSLLLYIASTEFNLTERE